MEAARRTDSDAPSSRADVSKSPLRPMAPASPSSASATPRGSQVQLPGLGALAALLGEEAELGQIARERSSSPAAK